MIKTLLKSLICLGLSIVFAASAAATTFMIDQPVSVTLQPNILDLTSFRNLVEIRKESFATGCATVFELPSALLCLSTQNQQMNEMLTRMGIFWGAGTGLKPGTLVPHDYPFLVAVNKVIAGHNLPGKIIEDFLVAVDRTAEDALKLNSFEKEFADQIIHSPEVSSLKGQYYVIGVSIESKEISAGALAHELQHAQYHLRPEIKNVVRKFWIEEISEQDKAAIRRVFASMYNSDQEEVMIDEFQAYILEDDAILGFLGQFVEPYRATLLAKLKAEAGYVPLQIKIQ